MLCLHLVFAACLAVTIAATSPAATDTTTSAPNNATTHETSTNSTKEILTVSETADPGKVEIVKQIRRLNEDGSYTIGYEADDGTFKIESRDVLGNVKGTFGYIDQDGEIKRVTYSSSGDTTPVPVTTSTTPSTPTMVVRVNKTISSTTRRPLATVVYPTRSGIRESATRGTVIQSIPRRRPVPTRPTTNLDVTTEKIEETTSNILNLYKSREESKTRTQISKPTSATVKDDLITKQTTTNLPSTVKPVHEHIDEDEPEANKANTIRRELPGTSPNLHMLSLQQSVGDDSTDVYGGHQSHGSVRPLFTTTTSRPRILPLHSLVTARQKLQRHYQDAAEEQETTVEASTGRVFDQQSVVTTNPVPVVHIQTHRDTDGRLYQEPIYRRPQPTVHFRTEEYLRDNPGAPVPIGNQRPFLHFEYPEKVLEQQIEKETPIAHPTKSTAEPVTIPYDMRPVGRIIPIPVDERGVPIQGYQARFVNPYRSTPTPVVYQQRYDPLEEMNSIQAPVSTRDLKRLLQILILRQNRLQSLMDQIVAPGPPYQPLPVYRQNIDYNRHQMARRYMDEDQYDYRYDQQQQYRQDVYSNQMNYDSNLYESQRYVPRRRLYSRPYDATGSSSNNIEETPEYLPADIREALLLKMLMLAINPDFMPTPAPSTELTTAAPTRKQVRNVQILGEEGSQAKPVHRH
ncbi:PREDICTED: uncharacterized protein LOC106124707 [Papilio xuthus]|uniref:Uncharacterized protein LOC106124707 n=1 Tax=Papilio xuthus TaxID=66420 RepID=A0AAJ6ZQ42_PAPXU|nr:PREDICTED: uncharacterized protein LOC106124707 [Papilio xuthus]